MRKLIIGVVAVLVLHIGFNSYMARDRAQPVQQRVQNAEAIKAINPVADTGPSVVDVAALWPEPVEIPQPVTRSVKPRSIEAPEPTLASVKRPKRAQEPTVLRAVSKPAVEKPAKPFTNTVIAIKSVPRARTEYPDASPSTTINYSESGKEKRKSEDPLFFTVFKKPAGWLKSVASKVF